MEISQLEEGVAVAIAISPERPLCYLGDYNHWLIVVEFPKDPSPTREQMIDTYLNTLATVLGSMEEAEKNMYAFSTTTYTGFSAPLMKRHLRNSRDCLVFSGYCQTHT